MLALADFGHRVDTAGRDADGLELARRLRALEPGLPIMIFSGEYAVGEIEGSLITPKPDIDALTRLIQRTLAPP